MIEASTCRKQPPLREAVESIQEDQGRELPCNGLVLRVINLRDAGALAEILSSDAILTHALSSRSPEPMTGEEMLEHMREWCRQTCSISFAIRDEFGETIGMISLSHVNEERRAARVGYWLASSAWGKGIATRAFGCVAALARELGVRSLSASIEADNTASRRIWLRHGATEREIEGDRFEATLVLHE